MAPLGFEQGRTELLCNLAVIFAGRAKDGRGFTPGVVPLCCSPEEGCAGLRRIYVRIVRLETRMPSLSSSPRIRSAPHRRLSRARVWINVMVSAASLGFLAAGCERYLQYQRNTWRCHLRRVSGWTIKSAGFHMRAARARRTRSTRSFLVQTGRFT